MTSIVLGYNDSPAAQAALDWAIAHGATTDSEIVMVYVLSSVWEWELAAAQVNPDPIRDEFHRLLESEWSQPLRDAGVRYRTVLEVGRPADCLMQRAQHEHASLIVVGMSHRGTVAELLFGSEARELQKRAHRPVVAVPEDWQPEEEGATAQS